MVNSTFHFFLSIPISHSTDLVNWKIIGYAITNPEWAEFENKDGDAVIGLQISHTLTEDFILLQYFAVTNGIKKSASRW